MLIERSPFSKFYYLFLYFSIFQLLRQVFIIILLILKFLSDIQGFNKACKVD